MYFYWELSFFSRSNFTRCKKLLNEQIRKNEMNMLEKQVNMKIK